MLCINALSEVWEALVSCYGWVSPEGRTTSGAAPSGDYRAFALASFIASCTNVWGTNSGSTVSEQREPDSEPSIAPQINGDNSRPDAALQSLLQICCDGSTIDEWVAKYWPLAYAQKGYVRPSRPKMRSTYFPWPNRRIQHCHNAQVRHEDRFIGSRLSRSRAQRRRRLR